MTKLILFSFVIISNSCKKDCNLEPVYSSIAGSWKLEKNEAIITFDIVADASGSGDFYTVKERVIYSGKTGFPSPEINHVIEKKNGFYTIDFWTVIENRTANRTYLVDCEPSTDYKQLTAGEGIYPDGSYQSLTGFADATTNTVVSFRSPIVIKRVN